ncbi:HD domain-containing protein [Alloacidobacterium dinghuense]|uniref:HD domain-containing protein n=1 Tax=Alloacidobacterium dinghuense TaxID=2763107 RepID=UPI002036E89A|nr:HD domain-containing protein [Alloacidobacterium dinghuense]
MTRNTAATDIPDTIQFVLEIDKLKGVLRKVRPIWEERYENTAEHSWQIALFAMSMARTLELKIDVTRVVAMLLVHDLGEIDAGDKFVFAQGGWEERKAAELKALERICGLAPKKTGDFLLGLWKEFDAGESDEARFAKAIDRCMPVLLNLNKKGGSWLEHGVSYERVVERVGPEIESGCLELWEYLKPQLEAGRRKGFFAASTS